MIVTVLMTVCYSCFFDAQEKNDDPFYLSDEIVIKMSTSELVNAILERPLGKYHLMPWCFICSNLNFPGVAEFNKELKESNIANELFKRNDCFSVLTSKYQNYTEETEEFNSFEFEFLAMLLASDMCMAVINENEKNQLMEIALENKEYKDEPVNGSLQIMVAVMQSCGYTPFVEEIVPVLVETVFGYTFNNPDNDLIYTGLGGEYHSEIIVKYATTFLIDNK